MRKDRAMELFGNMEAFNLDQFARLSGAQMDSSAVTLARWVKSGFVTPLRRGLFTIADSFRRCPLSLERVANIAREPSYLSCEWALCRYGMIAETVYVPTSVTSLAPATMKNAYGRFDYQHIKPELFWGYGVEEDGVLVASPEKALLDYIYLSRRRWSWDELNAELRLSLGPMSSRKLIQSAEKFQSQWIENQVEEILKGLSVSEESWVRVA